MKSVRCQQHPQRFYTNFCCSNDCMVALCPQCLPTHLRSHQCNSESIEPIQRVYERTLLTSEKCDKQIWSRLTVLRDRQSQLLTQSEGKNRLYLESFRKRVVDLVDGYFSKLVAKLQQAERNLLGEEKVKRTIAKFSNFKDEVTKVRKNLGECVQLNEAFRVMLSIDSMQFFENLRSQTDYISATMKVPSIQISQNALDGISKALQNAVTLKCQPQVSLQPVQMTGYNPATNLQLLDESSSNLNPVPSRNPESEPSQFLIDCPNYFSRSCPFKILHSFQPLTKNLYIVPLEGINGNMQIHRSQIESRWNTLLNSRSVMTSDGELFSIGGRLHNHQQSDPGISKFDFPTNTLNLIGAMKHPRQNHAVCSLNGYIFIVNGELEPGSLLKSSEKYDTRTNQSVEIATCNFPAAGATVCAFKNRYLLKFGGRDCNGSAIHAVERYDVERDVWEGIPVTFGLHLPASVISVSVSATQSFSFPELGFAVQINPKQVLFSCGKNNASESTGTAILREINEGEYVIRDISPGRLPNEGFFECQPVLHSQILHVIQHTPGQQKYNILVSDARRWEVLS